VLVVNVFVKTIGNGSQIAHSEGGVETFLEVGDSNLKLHELLGDNKGHVVENLFGRSDSLVNSSSAVSGEDGSDSINSSVHGIHNEGRVKFNSDVESIKELFSRFLGSLNGLSSDDIVFFFLGVSLKSLLGSS
jgi:hypothetical protein